MNLVKVGVAAINQNPLDWRGNFDRITAVLNQAQNEQIQFLGLPELALSGYGCEDAFLSPDVADTAFQCLLDLRPHTKGLFVNIGLPLRFKGALFNTNAILCDEKLVGIVPKKFLAGDGVHYEPRWFKNWPIGFSDLLSFSDSQQNQLSVPIGDLYFNWNDIRVGFEICEEAWVAQRPGAQLASESIDIIFNPSASHFSFGKNEIRKRFVLEGSRAFNCIYAYSNLLGNESGRLIFDGALLIASQGELINESKRFSYKDSILASSVVDLNSIRSRRSQTTSFNPVYLPNSKSLLEVKLTRTTQSQIAPTINSIKNSSQTKNTSSTLSKNEEFMLAVCLGLFDYLRKSHSQGFAISLSGGTDSSVTAVLSASALKLALDELGLDEFKRKLSHIKNILNENQLSSITAKLIHCIYQSLPHSSQHTLHAAQHLSQAIGVTFDQWSIDPIKERYEELVSRTIGRPLDWNQDDLALQNIQARVRSPGIWLLANIKGFLLLATSNRSEAAVGYATMDGDTSGGLSPIAGVDKAFLNQWIRWKGESPDALLGTIKELTLVYSIPPTAELRPPHTTQTDEEDLMPYTVLDFIERHLLIDRLKPMDIWNVLSYQFPEFSKKQLRDWLVLFLKLWVRNQWKRERFAPSFHLDSESLDPKTWCRFPILSKAFELDIEELNKII